MDLQTYGGNPGQGSLQQTSEVKLWSGPVEAQVFGSVLLAAAAVDAGSSPTTLLRPGLLLGKLTSTGEYVAYNPVGTDGSEVAEAVLLYGISTLDYAGVAAQKTAHVIAKGILIASSILNLDNQARRQLLTSGKFIFDDSPRGSQAFLGLPLREIDKAADYAVLASDNGTLFTASAAANFTLPALAQGLAFEFLNLADANMVITSAEGDNIVFIHDASADSLTFSTSSQKIGAHVQVFANAAGTKWYVRQLSPATITTTVGT